MSVDIYCSQPQYQAHGLPVWEALPLEWRGDCYGITGRTHGKQPTGKWRRDRPVIVAGHTDAVRAAPRPVIYVEHGAGQSYDGDRASRGNGSYSGGDGLENVILFVSPNETVVSRWRDRYDVPAIAVGCPRLDRHLPRVLSNESERPCVALTFHWDCSLIPETRSALSHYDEGLPDLVHLADEMGWRLLGHGHPRLWPGIAKRWSELGIESTPDIDEVLSRADVLCADNTSAMWEAAALDIPLVIMDAPWYRKDVEHGLRFWQHADAGIRVSGPDDLREGILAALEDVPWVAERRRAAAQQVYSQLDGRSSARAAEAIVARLTEDDGWATPRHRGGKGAATRASRR